MPVAHFLQISCMILKNLHVNIKKKTRHLDVSGEIETVHFRAFATLRNVSRVGVARLLSMRAMAGCVN